MLDKLESFGFRLRSRHMMAFLLVLHMFFVSCIGAVIPTIDSSLSLLSKLDLVKRVPILPVGTLRAQIQQDGIIRGKTCVFWSGWDPPMDGFLAGKSFKNTVVPTNGGCGVLYSDVLGVVNRKPFFSAGRMTSEQDDDRIRALSTAYAQTSTGIVYVLLQDGKDFASTSTWSDFEAPNLTALGSQVKQIFIIFWPSIRQQLLWKAGEPQIEVWPPPGQDPVIFDT